MGYMAWVPVAILYFLVGIGLLVLLLAPLETFWRAFQVRPLLRKYERMKGGRKTLPLAVQNSERYKKARRQEDLLHRARVRAWCSLTLIAFVLEGRILLQGYRWPPLPGSLDEINAFVSGMGRHGAEAIGRIGPLWALGGAVAPVVLGFVAMNLLDLLGDGLGSPVRAAGDRFEQRRRQRAREEAEARELAEEVEASPAIQVVNYYAELDLPTAARPEALAAALAGATAQWNRRLDRGDEAMKEKARRYLALISEAREILLDPERRREYDRQIGLRAGSPPGGSKRPVPVDARKVEDDVKRQIEEMKRKRRTMKGKGARAPEDS